MDKLVNGVSVPLTTEEESQRLADEQAVNDNLKNQLISSVYQHASSLLHNLVADYSHTEMLDWRQRESEARNLINNGISSPNLQTEIAGTTLTELQYANIIVAKADSLNTYRNAVINARNKHKENINNKTNTELKTYDIGTAWPLMA